MVDFESKRKKWHTHRPAWGSCGQSPCKYFVLLDSQFLCQAAIRVGPISSQIECDLSRGRRQSGCDMLWPNLQLVSGHVVGHSKGFGVSVHFLPCFVNALTDVFCIAADIYGNLTIRTSLDTSQKYLCNEFIEHRIRPQKIMSFVWKYACLRMWLENPWTKWGGHGWWLYRPSTPWRSQPLRWATWLPWLPWLCWSWFGRDFFGSFCRNPHEIHMRSIIYPFVDPIRGS